MFLIVFTVSFQRDEKVLGNICVSYCTTKDFAEKKTVCSVNRDYSRYHIGAKSNTLWGNNGLRKHWAELRCLEKMMVCLRVAAFLFSIHIVLLSLPREVVV